MQKFPNKIRLLPEVVANQIAAGEVVEEPSLAVKEMMENAIDAGARCIKVFFRNGGLDLIQVIDDGCGMTPFDARIAFDRHATSKITSFEDIYALHTFGFRGEALASISAISQVELRTRPAEDELGTETVISGGEFISQKPISTPAGSNFIIRNMFYNVPARRKHLRAPSVLAANIKSEFQKIALCYPAIAFELHSIDSGNAVTLRESTLATRITEVIGKHIKSNLLEVDADTSIVGIKGYVGRPAVAKKRNNEQYLFVNGRYFKSQYLNKAILKAYEKLIPDNCFPSYFIYITVDPERIDVNVSPHKTEVKFADMDAIWQILNAAVRETLAKTGAVSLMDFDNESNIEIPIPQRGIVYSEPRSAVNEEYNPFLINDDDDEDSPLPPVPQPLRSTAMPATGRRRADGNYGLAPNDDFSLGGRTTDAADEDFEEFVSGSGDIQTAAAVQDIFSDVNTVARPSFRAAAYIGSGYASAIMGHKLVVADLKRARERILYEDYILLLSGTSSVSQQLLFPERLVLSNDEYTLLEENADEFAALGFDMTFEGEGTVTVKGTPADTGDENIDELIFELLKAFDTPVTAAELRRERIAAAMARSGAAHTPKNISDEEAARILDRLAQSENISFSPSGKAVITEITIDEIRSKLG